MSIVNTVAFFDSTDFYEMVEDVYDKIPHKNKKAIEKRMEMGDRGEDTFLDAYRLIKEYSDPFKATQELINRAYEKKSL